MFRSDCLRIVLGVALAGASVVSANGQTAVTLPSGATYTPTLTFDVATVREAGPIVNGALKVNVVNSPHASQFEVTNFTANSLIQAAYGFDKPIANEPGWTHDKYFDVKGRSDAAADAMLAKLTDEQGRAEKAHALQVLLAERFGLKFHLETRETSVYAMALAKGGLKMKEIKAEVDDDGKPKPITGAAVRAQGGAQGLEFDCDGMVTRGIAAALVSQLNSPVIDRTGLTGLYAFKLQFGREWSARNPDSWPDIFTAVQEQLGLKLDATKAAIPVMVIDHIEAPSAN